MFTIVIDKYCDTVYRRFEVYFEVHERLSLFYGNQLQFSSLVPNSYLCNKQSIYAKNKSEK